MVTSFLPGSICENDPGVVTHSSMKKLTYEQLNVYRITCDQPQRHYDCRK